MYTRKFWKIEKKIEQLKWETVGDCFDLICFSYILEVICYLEIEEILAAKTTLQKAIYVISKCEYKYQNYNQTIKVRVNELIKMVNSDLNAIEKLLSFFKLSSLEYKIHQKRTQKYRDLLTRLTGRVIYYYSDINEIVCHQENLINNNLKNNAKSFNLFLEEIKQLIESKLSWYDYKKNISS